MKSKKKKFEIEKIFKKKRKSILDQMKKIQKHEKYLKITQEFCELSKVFTKISIKAKKLLNHNIVATLKFFSSNQFIKNSTFDIFFYFDDFI